ncbi:FAD-dependent oxidoreductase, partial [bacterium]|nr:FAD-dependent oxidoreductase [bacterium]
MSGKGSVLSYQRGLRVRYEADILVAGGGPAGVAAAVAAARQNRSVCLIEAHSCLGGMGTAGMVVETQADSRTINIRKLQAR